MFNYFTRLKAEFLGLNIDSGIYKGKNGLSYRGRFFCPKDKLPSFVDFKCLNYLKGEICFDIGNEAPCLADLSRDVILAVKSRLDSVCGQSLDGQSFDGQRWDGSVLLSAGTVFNGEPVILGASISLADKAKFFSLYLSCENGEPLQICEYFSLSEISVGAGFIGVFPAASASALLSLGKPGREIMFFLFLILEFGADGVSLDALSIAFNEASLSSLVLAFSDIPESALKPFDMIMVRGFHIKEPELNDDFAFAYGSDKHTIIRTDRSRMIHYMVNTATGEITLPAHMYFRKGSEPLKIGEYNIPPGFFCCMTIKLLSLDIQIIAEINSGGLTAFMNTSPIEMGWISLTASELAPVPPVNCVTGQFVTNDRGPLLLLKLTKNELLFMLSAKVALFGGLFTTDGYIAIGTAAFFGCRIKTPLFSGILRFEADYLKFAEMDFDFELIINLEQFDDVENDISLIAGHAAANLDKSGVGRPADDAGLRSIDADMEVFINKLRGLELCELWQLPACSAAIAALELRKANSFKIFYISSVSLRASAKMAAATEFQAELNVLYVLFGAEHKIQRKIKVSRELLSNGGLIKFIRKVLKDRVDCDTVIPRAYAISPINSADGYEYLNGYLELQLRVNAIYEECFGVRGPGVDFYAAYAEPVIASLKRSMDGGATRIKNIADECLPAVRAVDESFDGNRNTMFLKKMHREIMNAEIFAQSPLRNEVFNLAKETFLWERLPQAYEAPGEGGYMHTRAEDGKDGVYVKRIRGIL